MGRKLISQYAEKLGEWFDVEVHEIWGVGESGKDEPLEYRMFFHFFSNSHIDDLLFTMDLEREIELSRKYLQRLEKLKKLAQNDFELVLDDGKRVKCEPELEVKPITSRDLMVFIINDQRKKLEIKVEFFEGGELQFQECRVQGFQEVKSALLDLINETEVKLKKKMKQYAEKVKFLKQPIVSYDQIFKPVVEKNGVSRGKLLTELVDKIGDAVREINVMQNFLFVNYACHNVKKRVKKRGEDLRYLEYLENIVENVKKLKSFLSYVDPHIVKFKMDKDHAIRTTNHIRCFHVPNIYFDCSGEGKRILPFVKRIKESGDGTDLLKYLDELEKFFTRKLQQELEKRRAKNQIKRIQSVNRKMML